MVPSPGLELHLVDGDFDTWAYRRRHRLRHARITATFHQTPDRLEAIAAELRPGMLDAIVCVSQVQVPYLRHLVHSGEILGAQIATLHNLHFYLWLVTEARNKIMAGEFYNWKNIMVNRLGQRL